MAKDGSDDNLQRQAALAGGQYHGGNPEFKIPGLALTLLGIGIDEKSPPKQPLHPENLKKKRRIKETGRESGRGGF